MSETDPKFPTPEVYPNMFNCTLFTDAEMDDVMDAPKQGVYLVSPRTGKGWFQKALGLCHAALFMRASDANIVAIAMGAHFAEVLQNQSKLGFLVKVRT